MNIRTVTLFGIILNIICIIKGQQKIRFPNSNYNNNNCIHTSGQPGSCVLFPKCQRHLIGPNLNGNTCGFEGNSPKICCPDQNTTSGGETMQVLSPQLDFECGEADAVNNNYNSTRMYPVVGGNETSMSEFPWAALVGVKINSTDPYSFTEPDFFCTGSLINEIFVLSAAHCLPRLPDVIRFGSSSITKGWSLADRDIIKTFDYPHYEIVPAYHDLVLFEMDYMIIFAPHRVNPICIPWSDSEPTNFINKKMTVVGWGATMFNGDFSDVLLRADIESFDVNDCDENYKTLNFIYEQDYPQGITEEFYICAGNRTASVDTCMGDSGGPIMYKEGNKYIIGGVTSKGNGCGDPNYPGLYINLRNPKYLQWIKDTAFII